MGHLQKNYSLKQCGLFFNIITILSFWMPGQLKATQFLPLDIEKQINPTTIVVKGKIVETSSILKYGKVLTHNTLRVDVIWPKAHPFAHNENVSFTSLGGQKGEMVTYVEGAPQFITGQEVLLLLSSEKGDELYLQGLSLGVFDIFHDENGATFLKNRAFPHHQKLGKIGYRDTIDYLNKKFNHSNLDTSNIENIKPEIILVKNKTQPKEASGNELKPQEESLDYSSFMSVAKIIVFLFVVLILIKVLKRNKIILFWMVPFFYTDLSASVFNRTSTGNYIRWSNASPRLTIYVNTNNNDGLAEEDVLEIIGQSSSQWTTGPAISFSIIDEEIDSPPSISNRISFSTSHIIGAGVVGYTEVTYNGRSGEISNASIILNDNFDFSDDPLDTDNVDMGLIYLGDVVTHELGHLLGLSHSFTKDSSMFYSIFKGQNTTSREDISGASLYYPKGTNYKIQGKIVGGAADIGIFGVWVQAISMQSGEVAGSTLSATDGTFSIEYLDSDEDYFILTQPVLSTSEIPSYYHSIQTNFCPGGNFTSSFFRSCDRNYIGYPHAINFDSSSIINVGAVTIRCGLDSPLGYLNNKESDPLAGFNLEMEETDGYFGNSFSGFFNSYEKENAIGEMFVIDLSNYLDVQVNDYLEININSQKFFSDARMEVQVNRLDGYSSTSANISINSEGNYDISHQLRVPLSSVTSDNVFEVTVIPEKIVADAEVYDPNDFFPSYQDYLQLPSFYLFSSRIVYETSGVFYQRSQKYYPSIKDNTLCVDAPLAYSMVANTNNEDLKRTKSKGSDALALACASVAMTSNNGDPPGPFSFIGSFLLGFLFIFFSALLSKSFIKDNSLMKLKN